MKIVEVTEYSNAVLNALNEFVPQVSSSAPPMSASMLKEIVESESSHLLMATEDGEFYGSLTLIIFSIPTGKRAWVEDVVVDEKSRGKGLGRKLTEKAIELAASFGAKTVDLTSRPSREAANVLYRKVGFVQRETNVYRYEIDIK